MVKLRRVGAGLCSAQSSNYGFSELIVSTNFADAVDVSQSSIASVLAFLGHPCGGVVSEIEDFDNAPKS